MAKSRAAGKKVAKKSDKAPKKSAVEIIPDKEDPTLLAAAKAAGQAALDKKADNVRILDVRGLASYADYLVLMSASSDRLTKALADTVEDALTASGHKVVGREGVAAGNWVLLDTGDIVVHVFHENARGFYDLDSLWADAKRIAL